MTTRRSFIAGLLATAAAPAIPAQPAPIFAAIDPAVTKAQFWFLLPRPYSIRWSHQEDHNDWTPA